MALNVAELIVLGLLADWVFRRCSVPGFIGMLLVGVLLGPSVLGYLHPDLLAIGPDLRTIALVVILLRVGFELSRKVLHRVGGRVLLLAFLPATFEMIVVTLMGSWLLGMTWLESAMLGSVIAAVSPAVVVPLMIRFVKQRKGAEKDIPSMVMAAGSVDDIFVIVVHSALVGLYIGHQVNVVWQALAVPVSLCLGAVVGMLVGVGLYRLFDRFNPRATKRVLIVLATSIFLLRLQDLLEGHLPMAGLVSAMALGFVILERREHMAHEISAKLARIWVFAEILLFSMVGAQVNVRLVWQAGLVGLAIIATGLIGRSCGVLLCLIRSRLNLKERLFVVFAFCPKATVQAAIGASPLVAMRAAGMETGAGETILAIAVLSILVTAPLGAWIIRFWGDRVLEVAPETDTDAREAALESDPEDQN